MKDCREYDASCGLASSHVPFQEAQHICSQYSTCRILYRMKETRVPVQALGNIWFLRTKTILSVFDSFKIVLIEALLLEDLENCSNLVIVIFVTRMALSKCQIH